MIIGNKLIPFYNTLAYKGAIIMEILETQQKISLNDLHTKTSLSLMDLINTLDFLYAIDYINLEGGLICLTK